MIIVPVKKFEIEGNWGIWLEAYETIDLSNDRKSFDEVKIGMTDGLSSLVICLKLGGEEVMASFWVIY